MDRCTVKSRQTIELVTVTFDPENIIDTIRALQDVICPENLRAVGLALADAGSRRR